MIDVSGVRRIPPRVYIYNRLSRKPQQAVERLRTAVENQDLYNVGMSQDYSKNVVVLKLYGRGIVDSESRTRQTREIPITSSAKRYTKAFRQMVNEETEAVKSRRLQRETQRQNAESNAPKKSMFRILLEALGL